MGKIITCEVCGESKPILAKNMCRKCYVKKRTEALKADHPKPYIKDKETRGMLTEEDVVELDRLSMWSKQKTGRPVTWDEESIAKFGDELLEFAERKTSLVLAMFVLEKRMNPDILSVLADASPSFSESLKTAKRIIGSRREVGAMAKKLDSRVCMASQRMYDSDYDQYKLNELEKEEFIKAKAKIRALEEQLKLKEGQDETKQIIVERMMLS